MMDHWERNVWAAWSARRRRSHSFRCALAGWVAGGLIGQELLHVPEPGWLGLIGAVLGLVAWWLTYIWHVGHMPGWPGYRCILAAAEGRVPRGGCRPGRQCPCVKAELLEQRIAQGLEWPHLTPPQEEQHDRQTW